MLLMRLCTMLGPLCMKYPHKQTNNGCFHVCITLLLWTIHTNINPYDRKQTFLYFIRESFSLIRPLSRWHEVIVYYVFMHS